MLKIPKDIERQMRKGLPPEVFKKWKARQLRQDDPMVKAFRKQGKIPKNKIIITPPMMSDFM
jgi:hypothetical protein